MHDMFDLLDKIKKYFSFSPEETRSIVIAILVLGFVLGFDDGAPKFELYHWLKNLLNSMVIVSLAILVRESAQRIYGLYTGHRVEFKLWWFGLGTSLIMAIVSFGKIPLLFYGGFVAHFMPRHRVGYFRYGLSYNDMGTVALWGNLANIILALIFKIFMFLPNPLIKQAMIVNIIMACTNMLPIPPLSGSTLFFASPSLYSVAYGVILGASVLMLFTSIKMTIIGTLVIAPLFSYVFTRYFENLGGANY
ncbi:MAG: hypothetical protein ABIG95_01330 [Candidatus Woesearchaeota archaeon]